VVPGTKAVLDLPLTELADGQSSVFPSSPSMEQSLVRAFTSVPLSTATRLPAYRSSAQRYEEKTAAFGAEIPH